MPPVQIKPDIYWIGVNDRTTDLFEGLWPITQGGVSYNTYLINDEKKKGHSGSKGFLGPSLICQKDNDRRATHSDTGG